MSSYQRMSNCQKDVKMSKRCESAQIVKMPTVGLGRKLTKKIDIMRFNYNDVNFDVTNESHQNWSKNIL